jgi:hypothetical protein
MFDKEMISAVLVVYVYIDCDHHLNAYSKVGVECGKINHVSHALYEHATVIL